MENSQLTAPSYIPMNIVPTRISALLAEQSVYMNKPKMQRSSESWPRRKRQYFIESLLRGIPVGSLILHHDAEQRAGKLWIADGLQRLTAITDFAQGKFKTGRLRPGSPSFGAFEPNKSISQLSQVAVNQFKGYALPLYVIETADPEVIKFIFLSLQESVQLTLAEKIYAHGVGSDSMLAIEQIQEHEIFSSMYVGADKHKQTYMMAQFPMLLELFGGFANITGERLRDLNSNKYGERLTNALLERIEENLLLAQYLFNGVKMASKNEIVFMYQAISFLRLAGFDLANSEEGALTDWYQSILPSTIRGETKAFSSLLSQIHKNAKQQQFWQMHSMDFALSGLRFTSENLSNMERIGMWLHYRHFCPGCGEPIADVNRIQFHKFLPTDGPCLHESIIKSLIAPELAETH